MDIPKKTNDNNEDKNGLIEELVRNEQNKLKLNTYQTNMSPKDKFKNKKENNNEDKNGLIKELLRNEKSKLNLDQFHTDTSPEDEYEDKIAALLEEEKRKIFGNEIQEQELSNVQFEGSVPNREILKKKIVLPVIPKHKIDKFFSVLKRKNRPSTYEKELNKCLAHLHTSSKPPWNAPSVILKAIKDAILKRKWKNLTELVLMLLNFPDKKYKPVIRHMCQIIQKLHPTVQQHGLQEQFTVISLARKMGNTKLVNH